MNFEYVFELSKPCFDYQTNSVYFYLYGLTDPIPFNARVKYLTSGDGLIYEFFLVDGKKWVDRQTFFNCCECYTLRVNEYKYSIHVEGKPDNIENFAKEYLPLILKYKIKPTIIQKGIRRYNGTKEPVPYKKAKCIAIKAGQEFRDNIYGKKKLLSNVVI